MCMHALVSVCPPARLPVCVRVSMSAVFFSSTPLAPLHPSISSSSSPHIDGCRQTHKQGCDYKIAAADALHSANTNAAVATNAASSPSPHGHWWKSLLHPPAGFAPPSPSTGPPLAAAAKKEEEKPSWLASSPLSALWANVKGRVIFPAGMKKGPIVVPPEGEAGPDEMGEL